LDKELKQVDFEIAQILQKELNRQRETIELIASENLTSEAVLAAQGSIMSNKYAEGLPGDRYYGGCHFVDEAENLAIQRAKDLFGAQHANVQPHSGSQANMAVYLSVLSPGDTVLGLNLAHGGHLTHGSKANFSGKLYNFVSYGVSEETERLDYEKIRRLAIEHRPKMIVTGASAYPRVIDFEMFAEIAKEVDAYLMVDMAHIAGLIAAGVHPSPVPCSDFVTATTHKTLRGPRSGFILCKQKYAHAIDKAVFPGIQGGPMMHEIAAKAVAFLEASLPEFVDYQKQIIANAQELAKVLAEKGFRIVSGGTDNHLLLVDLRQVGVSGKDAEDALEDVGIIANKNAIPFDPQPPSITSGIRFGAPAVTTRGMKEPEMRKIGEIIAKIIIANDSKEFKEEAKKQVSRLCGDFPIYKNISYI
jgi:glycine hydroxymethyltransferase